VNDEAALLLICHAIQTLGLVVALSGLGITLAITFKRMRC
jgi:hypothetical protein